MGELPRDQLERKFELRNSAESPPDQGAEAVDGRHGSVGEEADTEAESEAGSGARPGQHHERGSTRLPRVLTTTTTMPDGSDRSQVLERAPIVSSGNSSRPRGFEPDCEQPEWRPDLPHSKQPSKCPQNAHHRCCRHHRHSPGAAEEHNGSAADVCSAAARSHRTSAPGRGRGGRRGGERPNYATAQQMRCRREKVHSNAAAGEDRPGEAGRHGSGELGGSQRLALRAAAGAASCSAERRLAHKASAPVTQQQARHVRSGEMPLPKSGTTKLLANLSSGALKKAKSLTATEQAAASQAFISSESSSSSSAAADQAQATSQDPVEAERQSKTNKSLLISQAKRSGVIQAKQSIPSANNSSYFIANNHQPNRNTRAPLSTFTKSSNRLFAKNFKDNNNQNKMADQAVIEKLEAGFAKLQAATPDKCHSLLKKYLTREVLDKIKTRKTAMGATLLDVAQSGFENLDSGVGIYAPDAESYTLFKELFDPIIQDYHGGFKPTDKHPASDFGDLETLVNVDPQNEYVISTRVRCGRSLKGYPFNPCLTEAQYKEMEAGVTSAFKEMEGDLAGTYYPLTGMTKETQKQLIDDHFLFKEGDRFLQAANACRYWPTGRGIYHNAAKTFLVWVNEEDHLRIISMQKGGDLKEVFGRLVKGAKAIEAKVPFSRDDRLGFLTFCPTNLGTTIRASVHIKLPKLAADRKKLEEVASRYNLQVRGTSGEHTESIGGIYDISNKRRLGLTEYQAVREMQDGILELIKIEKSL